MPRLVDNNTKLAVISLRQQGYKLSEISKRLGIAHSTVRLTLVDAGMYVPDKRVKTCASDVINSNKDNIIAMYQSGVIPGDIASQLNITRQTLTKYLRDWGVYTDGRSKGNNRRKDGGISNERN